MNWTLLLNSLLVASAATLLSVALGLVAALWLAGLEPRWRSRWLAAAIVALSLPPFLVTNCWMYYLGQNGIWRGWLPLNIFSAGGTIWILALLTWPITLLFVLGAWQRLEAAQLESDPAMTGPALLRGLLLPLARGPLTQAIVLTFVLALNNFAVPAILQEKVLPAEVWVSFNTTFNTAAAVRTSWPMVVIPLVLLICLRRAAVAWPRVTGPVPPKLFRQQLGSGWFRFCGTATIILCLLSVALPILQLATTKRTWTELPGAVAAGQLAIWHSFSFAAITASICIAIGLISWRLPLGVAVWAPFLVPGVLLGIGLISLFNNNLFAAFYHSAGIVILAFTIRYLAFGWNGTARALRMADRDLTDAARIEGASRWQMLREVYWPQISSQLAVAWYLVFLLCLWDAETIVLIVPPGGETLALRIFNLLHYGHNPQVNALCLTLLALALAPLVLWRVGKFAAQWKPAIALASIAACFALAGCSPDNGQGRGLHSKIFSSVEIIGSRGVGVGQFNKPRSVAVDHQDNLYVVDITGRVQKFSPDGKHLLTWQMHPDDMVRPRGEPKGMGIDHDGNIIVVEPHYQRLTLFTPDGKQLEQWGHRGTNAGQLIMPRAAALNKRGDYFVPEYSEVDRVQQFDGKTKELIRVIGHSGTANGDFSRPEGLCIDDQDRLYVADSCNHRIQVFSQDGKWLRSYGQAGSAPGEFSYPYDIRLDKEGRQYVCEFGNSRIQVFDRDDQLIEVIGGPGEEPGQFNNPWAMAFDSKGNLYVADSQNHRVQKLIRRREVADAGAVTAKRSEVTR